MSILDKLTELSFLELRRGRIYIELGGDVTDEMFSSTEYSELLHVSCIYADYGYLALVTNIK